jgi:hypothetical protein
VRGRDDHSSRPNARQLLGSRLGVVEQFAREHARVDDDDRHLRGVVAVIQDDRPGVQQVIGLGRDDLGKAAVDDDGERRGGDVLGVRAGAQGGAGDRREAHHDQDEERCSSHRRFSSVWAA